MVSREAANSAPVGSGPNHDYPVHTPKLPWKAKMTSEPSTKALALARAFLSPYFTYHALFEPACRLARKIDEHTRQAVAAKRKRRPASHRVGA
jgi:hypothetical protein